MRQTILIEKTNVVCLQETKMEHMDDASIRETCGNWLDQRRILGAQGTRGGIILAWSGQLFEETQHNIGNFSVSVLLKTRSSSQKFWITTVYGPSTPHSRQEFLIEIHP